MKIAPSLESHLCVSLIRCYYVLRTRKLLLLVTTNSVVVVDIIVEHLNITTSSQSSSSCSSAHKFRMHIGVARWPSKMCVLLAVALPVAACENHSHYFTRLLVADQQRSTMNDERYKSSNEL